MLKTLYSRLLDADGAARGASFDGGADCGVLSLDEKGRVRGLSGQAPLLLKRPRPAVLGAALADLFAEEDRPAIARGLSLGAAAGPVAVRLKDQGDALDLRFGARRAQRTPVLLTPSQGKDSQPSPAFAEVSHEMRTPLNAVIGFADAMLAETYGPLGHGKYQEYAGIIRSSGRHLLDLVNSALDLAKLEAGRYRLKRETVDVAALVRECASLIRLEAEKAGLKIEIVVDEPLPEAALDARALRQVLINLLSNALKFTSDGEIRVEARSEEGALLLIVSDTGIGMNAAQLETLGRRFSPSADGVRGAKGAGLGLALARALVAAHGGALVLDSAPGQGLRAEARFPIVRPARPERRLRAVSPDETAPAPAVLSQLERVEAYRRERARNAA